MANEILILSWNIRGIKDRTKKRAMFDTLGQYLPSIVCLQETHLTRDTVNLLQNKMYPFSITLYILHMLEVQVY